MSEDNAAALETKPARIQVAPPGRAVAIEVRARTTFNPYSTINRYTRPCTRVRGTTCYEAARTASS